MASETRQGFIYARCIAAEFTPRDAELRALHDAAYDKQAAPAMREYITGLIRGWMDYLHGEAVLFRSPYNHYLTATRKRAIKAKDQSITYNFLRSPSEQRARKLSRDEFASMSHRDRVKLVDRHPEILLCGDGIQDAVSKSGVMSPGFEIFMNLGFYLPDNNSRSARPEDYLAGIGMKGLLQIAHDLTDDSNVISLRSGVQKGEVCLACRQVDP